MEGSGHYPHVEDPAAVERIIVEFMTGTEPGHIDHSTPGADAATDPRTAD